MRIAFTGGGTAGHVLPNIAVIEEIKGQTTVNGDKKCGIEVFYVGEKGSVEEKLAQKYNVPFYSIRAGKLRRYFDVKNFIDAFKVPLGVFDAYRILKKQMPDLVFAKGGYVSVPVAIAAWLRKIPIWLHESDFTPGLSTKICSKLADKIFLSFEESKTFFRGKGARVVGNPIRKSVLRGNRNKGFKLTGFSHNKPVLLIMGGSSGATSLNKIIYKILPELLCEAQIIHITGPHAEKISSAGYKQFELLDEELADCYAISELVVSRAGSGSIFEILAVNKPLILVPLPKCASRGDQIQNAHIAAKHNWAFIIDQKTTGPESFLATIKKLLADKKLQRELVSNQKKAVYSNAAKRIAREIFDFSTD